MADDIVVANTKMERHYRGNDQGLKRARELAKKLGAATGAYTQRNGGYSTGAALIALATPCSHCDPPVFRS